MALNVGVNVIEVDGKASPTIQAAATSVAAFLGYTERGLPNQPVRLVNAAQFRERLGTFRGDGLLLYAIDGFFQNGGREAYVSRIVSAGSVAAFAQLNNRATPAAPSLRLRAGSRGVADPGNWGNRIRFDIRDDARLSTQLQADVAMAATKAQLVSIVGLQVGSVVRFYDSATPTSLAYRRLVAVDSVTRTIEWKTGLTVGLAKATTEAISAEFRIVVFYQSEPTADFVAVEDWRQLSMEEDSRDYVVARINHPISGSSFILVIDESGVSPSGIENPMNGVNQMLTAGVDVPATSTDFIGDQAKKSGFYALDTSQVQLLAIPDMHTLATGDRDAVLRRGLDYCANRGDCMFIGSAPDRGRPLGVTPRVPQDYTQPESVYLGTLKTFIAPFQGAKVYGALYAPWIQVSDPLTTGTAPTRFVPPEGHVMGVYARTEQERGIFKAPAGQQAAVRGALGTAATFSDVEHTAMVREFSVNGIRALPGQGITIAASRTLSTDTRWWFVSTRLLFNFIKSSLREGLRFVRQEPHSDELRRSVRFNVVTPFLLGLWRQGAFGSAPAAQVFSVKCDAENNPAAEVNLGNFRVEVFFYPVRPAETIVISVGQQPSGASAKEA